MKIGKKPIIISVISLLLVAVIIALVIFFNLPADSPAKKKIKKVIKVIKKPETSSQDDNASSEDNYSSDYYDDEWDDSSTDYNSDEPEEESSTTSPTTSSNNNNSADEEEEEKVKSPYDVDFPESVNSPASKQIGLSIYHYYTPGQWDTLTNGKFGKESDFMNYYYFNNIATAKKVKEIGGVGWIYVRSPFENRETLTFKSTWLSDFEATIEAYKFAGLWDVVAGFHTEEICNQITGEQFRVLTKYLKDTCPEKRIFACLSVYEVQGYGPAGVQTAPMSYRDYGYVTDIGFDWYGVKSYDEHKNLLETMKSNIGRKDVRIWFYPCTYGSNTSENYMIEHLNMCYKLLMEQENPGGLDLYTWQTWDSNSAGLDRLLDPDLTYNYERLAKRIVEIGKEIKANPYRYEKTYN